MFVTQTWTNLDAAITDSTLIHTESNTSFSGFGRDGKISRVHLVKWLTASFSSKKTVSHS